MTLAELSVEYRRSAQLLGARLHELRAAEKTATPTRRQSLRHQIYLLGKMQHQMYDLARLTAHYYERGYYRDKKYTL